TLLLPEGRFDRALHLRRLGLDIRRKTSEDLTVTADQEFFEIPFNLAGEFRIRALRRQVVVQRDLSAAEHLNLGKHVELNTIVCFAKLLDLGITSGSCCPKSFDGNPIIARPCDAYFLCKLCKPSY